MNVLFVFNKPLDVCAGGVERVTDSVMKGLRENGIQSFYLEDSGTELFCEGRPVSVEKFFSKNSIDVVVQQLAYDGVIARYLREKEKRIPYIVAWHTAPPTWKKSWRVATTKSFGNGTAQIRRLLRITFYPFFYLKEIRRFRNRWKKILPRITKILLLSSSFKSDFQRLLRLPASRFYSIPNPLSFVEIAKSDILSSKRKEVLVVARMKEQQKRISLVLKIWQLVEKNRISADWVLRIVGDGETLPFYRELAKWLKLEHVRFLGSQNPIPFYKTASLLMMTSAFEGWGLTLTESQQFGVVPVAFDSYASIRDIVEDGKNGFLVPFDNLKEFARKMTWLMENPETRNGVARNCLESVHRFEISKIIPRWKSLLTDVCEGS